MARGGSASDYMATMLMWLGMTVGAHAAMPEEEKAALRQWERENLGDGRLGTSDWPGWAKYLPPKPTAPLRHVKPKKPIPARIRTAVFERDAYRCQHCGAHTNLCVDHIYPESKGGPTALHNLQTLCRSCNTRKGASIPGS